MPRLSLFALVAVPALVALAPSPASAEMIGGNPGPAHNYVCPHADGQAPLDCYFDAVQHLYTMCRNVKAIEIIEFGYEDSQEGVNGSKYEYCLDKQKNNMKAPLQAALREARVSKQAAEGVRSLHEYWLVSMQQIRWVRGESDEAYKTRLARIYDDFRDKIEGIRTIVAIVRERTSPVGTARAQTPAQDASAPAAKPAKSARAVKAAPAAKTAPAAKAATPAPATTTAPAPDKAPPS